MLSTQSKPDLNSQAKDTASNLAVRSRVVNDEEKRRKQGQCKVVTQYTQPRGLHFSLFTNLLRTSFESLLKQIAGLYFGCSEIYAESFKFFSGRVDGDQVRTVT